MISYFTHLSIGAPVIARSSSLFQSSNCYEIKVSHFLGKVSGNVPSHPDAPLYSDCDHFEGKAWMTLVSLQLLQLMVRTSHLDSVLRGRMRTL